MIIMETFSLASDRLSWDSDYIGSQQRPVMLREAHETFTNIQHGLDTARQFSPSQGSRHDVMRLYKVNYDCANHLCDM